MDRFLVLKDNSYTGHKSALSENGAKKKEQNTQSEISYINKPPFTAFKVPSTKTTKENTNKQTADKKEVIDTKTRATIRNHETEHTIEGVASIEERTKKPFTAFRIPSTESNEENKKAKAMDGKEVKVKDKKTNVSVQIRIMDDDKEQQLENGTTTIDESKEPKNIIKVG